MKYRYFGFFLILLLAAFMASCGGGSQPGSPGSEGDTGVSLTAVIVGLNDQDETNMVDAFPDVCDDGKAEPFFDHTAKITVFATLTSPDIKVQPGTIHITDYTIDFVRSDDSVGAPPIEQFHDFATVSLTPPSIGLTGGSTSVLFTGMLVDIQKKLQYVSDLQSGQFTSIGTLNRYTAVYTFHGQNDYGANFSFKVNVPFQIGNYDNCGG